MCSCERATILKTHINITGCFHQLSCLCVIRIKCVVLGEPLIENTSWGGLWGIKMEYKWTGINRLHQATSFGWLHQTGSWYLSVGSSRWHHSYIVTGKSEQQQEIFHMSEWVWVSANPSSCSFTMETWKKNAHVSIIKQWLFNGKNVKQEARLSAFTESNHNRKWWEG